MKPAKTGPRWDEAPLRVAVLGANVWVILVLWPLLGSRAATLGELCFGLFAPVLLLLGLASRRRDHASSAAAWLWLLAFPTALGATVALRPESANAELYGPFALALSTLSLCAYAAAAIAATRPRGPSLAGSQVPLGDEPWDAPPPKPSRGRLAFVATCLLGAAALCIIAPHLGGAPALELVWGEAAASGGTLAAVAGAALAVMVVGVHLGEGLRGGRPQPPAGDAGVRTAWYLFLTLLGGVTYFITQP